jgi:hypothetical protein
MEETPSAQAGTGMRFSIHIVNAGKCESRPLLDVGGGLM